MFGRYLPPICFYWIGRCYAKQRSEVFYCYQDESWNYEGFCGITSFKFRKALKGQKATHLQSLPPGGGQERERHLHSMRRLCESPHLTSPKGRGTDLRNLNTIDFHKVDGQSMDMQEVTPNEVPMAVRIATANWITYFQCFFLFFIAVKVKVCVHVFLEEIEMKWELWYGCPWYSAARCINIQSWH